MVLATNATQSMIALNTRRYIAVGSGGGGASPTFWTEGNIAPQNFSKYIICNQFQNIFLVGTCPWTPLTCLCLPTLKWNWHHCAMSHMPSFVAGMPSLTNFGTNPFQLIKFTTYQRFIISLLWSKYHAHLAWHLSGPIVIESDKISWWNIAHVSG